MLTFSEQYGVFSNLIEYIFNENIVSLSSYLVEVSINLWDWEIVADHTRDLCRSWQSISFSRRPVVFVRIIGTHNTMNEVFHCVHFECPDQSIKLPSAGQPSPSSLSVVTAQSQPAETTLEEEKDEKDWGVEEWRHVWED